MNREALAWISGQDTGISSKTIWAVMMGAVDNARLDSWDYDTPSDDDDFGRCYRLLALIPEWRDRLPEVGEVFPKWKPLIRNWDELTTLHKQGKRKEVYALIQSTRDESMELAGYEKMGPGSWRKGNRYDLGSLRDITRPLAKGRGR